MTVRLRAHHLLCLLTYSGRGYDPAFTANFDAVLDRINNGEEVVVISAADDICSPLLDNAGPHCHGQSVLRRDRAAAADLSALLESAVQAGSRLRLDADLIARMREAFSAGLTRRACSGCEWSHLCSMIAVCGYGEARLVGLHNHPICSPPALAAPTADRTSNSDLGWRHNFMDNPSLR